MEEVQRPEVVEKIGGQRASATAFVEGGVQPTCDCDDACSICLEDFRESDPPAITGCKHEFHLHCILEWCQRSSQCPMCWQHVYLLDPVSQGLFDGVERERNFRFTRSRSSTIFQHPAIRHFDLQHLPVGESDTELEEHVIQQFIAAAMGRRQHIFQSETQRSRSIPRGHRQFLVFPVPNAPPGTEFSSSSAHSRGENEPAPHRVMSSSVPHDSNEDAPGQPISLFPVQTAQSSTLADGPSSVTWANRGLLPENWISEGQPSLGSQDGAGPSDFQSFSESFKSRLSSLSMRYRESISRSARGWTEKWFSRSSSMDGPGPLGSEVQREVNAGVASGSRVLDHLENSGSTGSRLAP